MIACAELKARAAMIYMEYLVKANVRKLHLIKYSQICSKVIKYRKILEYYWKSPMVFKIPEYNFVWTYPLRQ